MSDLLNISVDGGKYTLIQRTDGGLEALRHGEPWRDCVGDGLILALGYRVEALETALRKLSVAAASVAGDYAIAIDLIEYPEEAEESRALLAELREALDGTRGLSV